MLEESLKRLNNWEKFVREKKIPENKFLTRQTAEGLRVTLMSTIYLTIYLMDKYNCSYVLTRKLNQDALEVRCRSQFFKNIFRKTAIFSGLLSSK